MILGVTGCPGSGKTLFSRAVAGEGWELLDVDVMGRECVENNDSLLTELASAFGSDILDADGGLNRKLLAERAFASARTTKKLNAVVHPRLVKQVREAVREKREAGVNTVVDCALLFEWGIQSLFDVIICVHADEKIRLRRLAERDGRSDEEIRGMFAAQLPQTEKVLRSDIALKNDRKDSRITGFGTMARNLSHIHVERNNE